MRSFADRYTPPGTYRSGLLIKSESAVAYPATVHNPDSDKLLPLRRSRHK
jgi:hypothetical protein